MRHNISFLAALAIVAGCGDVPDSDDTGRIRGTRTDAGVTGCDDDQVGRTLVFYTSGPIGDHVVWASTTRTWCCPTNSTFGQCPRPSLPLADCVGAWPGTTCPTPAPVYNALGCTTDSDCDPSRACVPNPTRENPNARQCLGKCTLPQGVMFAACERNVEICALAPNQTDTRRGVCYPVR
jgi:hypothetical protein